MKKPLILSTLILSLSFTNALADVVAYKERFSDGRIPTEFQYLYYPHNCSFIAKIKDDPNRYIVRDKENLTTVSRKCFALEGGKALRKAGTEMKEDAQKLYDKTGVKSFFKGLMGN